MDRYDYIESIIHFIQGTTTINFQNHIGDILAIYYSAIGKTYEVPDYFGGDFKNDGWVIEDALFYQIFSPSRLKESLKKEMQNKFVDDLSGLLKHVYKENRWGGRLDQFIFIVNTIDNNLPQDSERFYETEVQKMRDEYQVEFRYRVVNKDYIRELLNKITDIEILKQISSALHIKNMIDCNAITETIMIDLIIGISGNISKEVFAKKSRNEYERVSSVRKIEINKLEDKREEIESIISKLDVVELAVNNINQDILCENKFERVKNYIIERYNVLAQETGGTDLYERLVNEMLSYTNSQWKLEAPVRFLVVYVFDKCDIFEKE